MSQKNFALITSVVFGLIALLHLLRILNGWEAAINGGAVPMWASWVAVIVAAYLGIQGFKLSKKS